MSQSRVHRALTLMAVCSVLSACRSHQSPMAASVVPARGAAPGAVWQFTYLKALPGQRDRLAQFIERNWFVMDARAKARGYLVDNQLFAAAPGDTTYDLLEITMYADSASHARVDSVFRTVIRPGHVPQLVDGLSFRDLGEVVREATWRWRARSPDPTP
jgi:hypothetical protein